MTARRAPAAHLCLRVGSRHEVAFVPFPAKAEALPEADPVRPDLVPLPGGGR